MLATSGGILAIKRGVRLDLLQGDASLLVKTESGGGGKCETKDTGDGHFSVELWAM